MRIRIYRFTNFQRGHRWIKKFDGLTKFEILLSALCSACPELVEGYPMLEPLAGERPFPFFFHNWHIFSQYVDYISHHISPCI